MQKQNEAVLVSMLSSGTPATISEQLCKPMFAKLGQACVLHGCMCPHANKARRQAHAMHGMQCRQTKFHRPGHQLGLQLDY